MHTGVAAGVVCVLPVPPNPAMRSGQDTLGLSAADSRLAKQPIWAVEKGKYESLLLIALCPVQRWDAISTVQERHLGAVPAYAHNIV